MAHKIAWLFTAYNNIFVPPSGLVQTSHQQVHTVTKKINTKFTYFTHITISTKSTFNNFDFKPAVYLNFNHSCMAVTKEGL